MLYWLEFTLFCAVVIGSAYGALKYAILQKQQRIEKMNHQLVQELERQGTDLSAKAAKMREELGENWIMHPDCKIRWR